MGTRVTRWFLLCLAFLFNSQQTYAAQLTPLKVVYSSLSASESPLWVAKEDGIFEKHGLLVAPVFIEGGTRSMAAMLGGDAPVGVVGGSSPILARMRGADTIILAGVFNTMPFSLVVMPTIRTSKDLKDKKIAISTFGSSSDLAARMAIEHLGLKPVQDVAILQIGTGSTRVAAMASGSVHGTVVEFDNLPVIKKLGYHVLLDLSTLGIEYQHVVVASTESFVRSYPRIIDPFMRAWAEGMRFYQNNKEASKRAIAKYSKIKDAEGLEFIYNSYSRIFPTTPYPTTKGIQTIVASLQRGPGMKEIPPENFADVSWLKKLEAEGFFK
ncbi:ABC transporter substrate-binding protein [bacterium]|nr:MAG: ABC transporter substrate-binding protein [bacterium]